ncbi:MAG: hypothetical protein HYV35_08620 [Lentisphaerae bacterium]|nr:hypothetical protein [Lentisphaerota bacterium]
MKTTLQNTSTGVGLIIGRWGWQNCRRRLPTSPAGRGPRKIARLMLAGVAGAAGLGIWLNASAVIVKTTTWAKYNNATSPPSDTTSTDGRIALGSGGKGDAARTQRPAVISGATLQMWYTGYDGSYYRIYYATSPDGLTWTKYDNTIPADSDGVSTNGRIPQGTAGTGDDGHAYYASVIKDGNTYKMWYTGFDGFTNRIYYATSPDGLTWTKYSNTIPTNSDTTSTDGRIPTGTAGTGDDAHVITPWVIKDGNTYKMWYAGSDGSYYRIYYATSPDGLTWTKLDNTIPADSNGVSTNGQIPQGTAGRGDVENVLGASVIKEGNTYKMWYGGSDGAYRIYYATSPDGLTWTKYNNVAPASSDTTSTDNRIPLGTAGKGDLINAYHPCVITEGTTYRMWYVGVAAGGALYGIYHARIVPPPGTILIAH